VGCMPDADLGAGVQRSSPTCRRIHVPNPPADPLLTVRAAVVLLLSLLAGVSAAVLTYLAYHSVPGAVLAGGSAAGGAILLFNTVIGR
jgi:hypothetical protein